MLNRLQPSEAGAWTPARTLFLTPRLGLLTPSRTHQHPRRHCTLLALATSPTGVSEGQICGSPEQGLASSTEDGQKAPGKPSKQSHVGENKAYVQ